jgi:hypothetical protein
MGFETKWAGAAIRPPRDRRAPKSHRHGSWIERLLSSAFRTVVGGFALYGAAYTGTPYPGPLLPADDQPRFPGFGEVRPGGSRAAWEGIDNQTLKDIGIPDETEHTGEPQNRRSGSAIALEPYSRCVRLVAKPKLGKISRRYCVRHRRTH